LLVKAIALALCLQAVLPCALMGNDGAAEVALGGIRLKQESRVAMVKERLYISKKKVRVEYEFINVADKEITTEIAFPLPEYSCDLFWREITRTHKGDDWWEGEEIPFKVTVDGMDLPYKTEIRATLGGKDITDTLISLGIRIETFGDIQAGEVHGNGSATPSRSQIDRLTQDQINSLIAMGAVDAPSEDVSVRYNPRWVVKKVHHWNQVFPPRKVLRIIHEYAPQVGMASQFYLEEIDKPTEFSYNRLADPGCPSAEICQEIRNAIDERKKRKLAKPWLDRGSSIYGRWVRYILTTANTWQTPIKDFELVVERDPGEFITFCWDGPLEKVGANTFRARVKDFIPAKELTVYFLQP